jgi:hypothetical protein
MSFLAHLFRRVKLAPRDAEVIFDRHEPIGKPTDLVLPRRRWFGRDKAKGDGSSVHHVSPLKRLV